MSRSDHYLVPTWPAPAHIIAASTLRHGGTSENNYDSFNLSFQVGDNPERVQRNRQHLYEDWQLTRTPHWLDQQHGNSVINLDDDKLNYAADAAITQQAHKTCIVMTADCLPIFLCNQAGTEVGMIHAGWRGLLNGVISATIKACQSLPHELMAWLGPCIGPDALRLNATIKQAFITRASHNHIAFSGNEKHPYCNMTQLARMELEQAGVKLLYDTNYCTYQQSKQFFSYRRQSQTGRMAHFISIQPAAL